MAPMNRRGFKGAICHWSLANSHMSFVVPLFTTSKYQLQRKLKLARGPVRLSNHARRGADSTAIENDLIRVREIGVIENVESLRPELQRQCLGDGELLEQRRVEVDQTWPP